jgi:hypothetical protein
MKHQDQAQGGNASGIHEHPAFGLRLTTEN